MWQLVGASNRVRSVKTPGTQQREICSWQNLYNVDTYLRIAFVDGLLRLYVTFTKLSCRVLFDSTLCPDKDEKVIVRRKICFSSKMWKTFSCCPLWSYSFALLLKRLGQSHYAYVTKRVLSFEIPSTVLCQAQRHFCKFARICNWIWGQTVAHVDQEPLHFFCAWNHPCSSRK